ncbi:MAG: cysteine--tRNA ligase [PVC group bacterium]|nr:cysteine--tRNA ligase [PVC group bacterium]
MKIYNSLTSKKEEFKPLKEGVVKMYVCGPTVYDVSHIGHLRAAYVFDVIRRYLECREFKVTFVRNITDIDDKIIKKAQQELDEDNEGLNDKVKEVAEKYTRLYEEDMQSFGIKDPDIQPKATEHIQDMISMIRTLIDKDMAYASDGDVYFSVRNFPGYGKLSHQSVDQMAEGVRKAQETNKRDPLDFALWKKAKPGEPYWESPWGNGRPGWHIECSVMSTNYLDSTFDIHGGGRDLIFPHHENEIAQAEAATGKPFANCWIHNGLLTVEKEKMAKSLGNFVTIKEILEKYHPDVLKIFFLQAHYASTMDFSWQKMEEAKKAYERILIFLDKAEKISGDKDGTEVIGSFKEQFMEAMDDDFNTAKALAVLFDRINKCNKLFESDEEDKDSMIRSAFENIKEIANVFGLTFLKKENKISDSEIEEKIELRLKYKKEKNFKAADEVRDQLLALGIVLEDAKDGNTVWRADL